jgi:hypothetical protein
VAMLFIPESPKFLYEKGRFDQARNCLNYIAKFYGKVIDIKEIKFDLEDDNNDKLVL